MSQHEISLDTVALLLSALPKRIIVSPHIYTIKLGNIPEDKTKRIWGECSELDAEIRIDPRIPTREMVVDTVLHEIMHAVWNNRGISEKANEERIVASMATGMLGILQDNPRFLDWLRRGIKKPARR